MARRPRAGGRLPGLGGGRLPRAHRRVAVTASGQSGQGVPAAVRVLLGRRLTLACRFVVGTLFVYASYDTVLDPQPLADAIDDYRILPLALVNLVALTLPWVEMLTGLCLLGGLGVPGAGAVASGLAATYSIAIASVLMRGLDLDCGCFGG
ncbi:MAG: hypothetical protein EHM52_00240, partial [Actinomycetota bacterium]